MENAGTTLPQEGGTKMKLLPEDVDELDPNLQGTVKTALQVLKEVVRDPDDSGNGEPSIEEAGRRIRSAVERKDGEAEDGAIEDYQTAATRALWRDFPDQRRILRLRLSASETTGGGRNPAQRTRCGALLIAMAS